MTPCSDVKDYNILEAFTRSHFYIEDVKTWRFKQLTRRQIPHNVIFINTAVNKPMTSSNERTSEHEEPLWHI